MNLLKKIDHYLLTNHPVLWRTKVHYFVIFSLILGNVAAVFIGKLLQDYHTNTAFIFGLLFLGFSTLFWLISQARNKIKHYRFWDEVVTFSVYMLCAVSLFVNFIVFTQIPIVEYGFGGEHINYTVLIGGSLFVFIAATTTYLIAHTGLANILGIVLLHFIVAPLVIFVFNHPMAYVILFVFLFALFCSVSENSIKNRFMRLFLIPYIPLATSLFLIYMMDYSGAWYISDRYSTWKILIFMTVTTIFGSAFIIKQNAEPLS